MKNPYQKTAFLQSRLNRCICRRLATFMLCLLFCCFFAVFLSGCKSTASAVKKISDDLGDKVVQAHAFVDIWQITPSDPASNSAPTGKKVTVIGDIKSIPLVAKNGQTVKDYAEYRKTVTPAWYNAQNVTTEETLVCTGDNAKELMAFVKQKLELDKRKQANSNNAEDTSKK